MSASQYDINSERQHTVVLQKSLSDSPACSPATCSSPTRVAEDVQCAVADAKNAQHLDFYTVQKHTMILLPVSDSVIVTALA